MAYYVYVFSPETYEAFSRSSKKIAGFLPRQQSLANRIKPADKLICYVTKYSKWAGVLEITSDSFIDKAPIFQRTDDPFVLRFKVIPIVWLSRKEAIPIHEETVWRRLSFTRNHDHSSKTWTAPLRNSLTRMDDQDGAFLEALMLAKAKALAV